MCSISSALKSSDYLAPLRGNGEFKARVSAMLGSGSAPHALLICGEDGCGRNFAARLVAAAYLGDENNLVERGIHPDCVTLEGEGASGIIPVRAVREALSELSLGAVMANSRRCALVRDAFHLNQSSSAALLKSLEEPPAGVMYILTARSSVELLPTIRSRVVALSVLPVSDAECTQIVKKRFPSLSERELRDAVSAARGRSGLALALAGSLKERELASFGSALCAGALKGDRLAVMSTADKAKDRAELGSLLRYTLLALESEFSKAPEHAAKIAAVHDATLEALRDIPKNINLKLLSARLAARSSRFKTAN